MAQKTHEQYTVPQRWYQSKRLPLYFVVGGTFAGGLVWYKRSGHNSVLRAAFFFYNNAQHPHVESTLSARKDPLAEEHPAAAGKGADHKESMGRQFSREHGFHQGQNTDGIFPNTAMAKQLGKVMGTDESKK